MSSPSKGGSRLAVVLSHPTQYYSPWFRSLAGLGQVELKVFYLWDFGVRAQVDRGFKAAVKWDVDLLSGYSHEFVPNVARDPGTHHFFGLRNPGLSAALAQWNPAAVLMFGYKWYSHVRVMLWARSAGVPLIFRGDSHFIGRPRPGAVRTLLMRIIYRQFAAVTFVGAANRGYFSALGVPDGRLFFAPHSVDGALFDSANPAYKEEAAALRARLALPPGTRVFLFAGKLIPEKQPRELLDAFLALGRPDTALVFVGEGPEKEGLQAACRSGAEPLVRFLPFANQSEMPSRYLMADVFVLPSRGLYETWGLAVNEAMHMGVPCVVSDRVGCQQDLVTEGETGWVFASTDPSGLQKALGDALGTIESPLRKSEMLSAVRKRISAYTYTQTSDGLIAALASLGR